ncbi:hypothetical protein HAX54_005012 [Datura stramonium]|uniref:Pentatricopeptide repeat-containing protein n=1 Tax=Datura stramonium TaxID=4076 RepID=A0ABS8RU37_DATST|nr:hypothetical protein [Datura stramonium]
MGQIGCEPTIHTYNCFEGLCFLGRVEEAYELLLNIKKSKKKPDLYTYTAVMDGFLVRWVGPVRHWNCLKKLVEMGLTPNVVSYNTLVYRYFKEGRPLDGIGLLRKMKEENCVPDRITYSTLLHGLLKWGEIGAALSIYQEMLNLNLGWMGESKIKIDPIGYELVIGAFVVARSWIKL